MLLSLITQRKARQRHQKFLAFLRHIVSNVLHELDIHLIADSDGDIRPVESTLISNLNGNFDRKEKLLLRLRQIIVQSEVLLHSSRGDLSE